MYRAGCKQHKSAKKVKLVCHIFADSLSLFFSDESDTFRNFVTTEVTRAGS